MPLYDFECVTCSTRQEKVFKADDCPQSIPCDQCNGKAAKILVLGHGGIQCDSAIDIPWFESAVDNLQPDGERRVETRGEYKKYLKDNGMIASG